MSGSLMLLIATHILKMLFKKRKARYRLIFVDENCALCKPLNSKAVWQKIFWIMRLIAIDNYSKAVNFDR
jgi:hypothetical protein